LSAIIYIPGAWRISGRGSRSKSGTDGVHLIPHIKPIVHSFVKARAGNFQCKAIIILKLLQRVT
jgi:hypothetical protein